MYSALVENAQNNDQSYDTLINNPVLETLSHNGQSNRPTHKNSELTTAIILTKSMIGTFILYLPFLFSKVGIIYASSLLILFALLSVWSMLLLSECSDVACSQHYGEIGAIALKTIWGQRAVDTSIMLSQLGYCISYYTYVSVNISSCLTVLGFHERFGFVVNTYGLIFLQLLVYVPLSWLRRLSHLRYPLLMGNVLIFTAFLITFLCSVATLAESGPKEIVFINSPGLAQFISSTVIVFEGTSLILPIKFSMQNENNFKSVLFTVMLFLAFVFLAFSTVTYLAYGINTQRFATLNLPSNIFGTFVKILYCMAVMLTYPLQLYPVTQIIETSLFPSTIGCPKWLPEKSTIKTAIKNVIRTLVVLGTAVVSLAISTKRFDEFIALIGALCVIPLAYVFPPLFHLILCGYRLHPALILAESLLAILGTVLMVVCAMLTLVD